MESVHGHDVMHMMIDSGISYTRDSLKQAIEEKFGEGTLFHTCSAEDMDAYGIIDFLDAKGKFLKTSSEGFVTDSSKVCNH